MYMCIWCECWIEWRKKQSVAWLELITTFEGNSNCNLQTTCALCGLFATTSSHTCLQKWKKILHRLLFQVNILKLKLHNTSHNISCHFVFCLWRVSGCKLWICWVAEVHREQYACFRAGQAFELVFIRITSDFGAINVSNVMQCTAQRSNCSFECNCLRTYREFSSHNYISNISWAITQRRCKNVIVYLWRSSTKQ